MTKNYIKQVANMLGVETGEYFKVKRTLKDFSNPRNKKYYFSEVDGTLYNEDSKESLSVMNKLLSGEYEVVKIAFKPSYGTHYYIVLSNGNTGKQLWYDTALDYFCYENNNCFKNANDITKEDIARINEPLIERLSVRRSDLSY